MIKKTAALCLILILLLSVSVCLADSTPVIYRVTDDAGHTLYLMGTIHMGSEEMFPLGDAFEKAWSSSDLLAVEMDVLSIQDNLFHSIRYYRDVRYGIGDSAKNHLSQEAYALGVEKLGQPERVLKRLYPMMWVSLAEKALYAQLGCDDSHGVDAALIRRAREEGKPIVELEGYDSQINVIRSVPDEVANDMLLQILKNPLGAAMGVRMLSGAWQRGDEIYLNTLLTASRSSARSSQAYQTYDRLLYADRNDRFTQQAIQYLLSGQTALIAIGTAHVIGPDSVSRQLRDAGYRVERLVQ